MIARWGKVVGVTVAVAVFGGCGGGTDKGSTATTTVSASHQVVYVIGGYDAAHETPQQALNNTNSLDAVGDKVNVTYTDLTDGTTQQTLADAQATAPWTLTFSASAGTVASISGQESPGMTMLGDFGWYCAIKVDGAVVDIHGTTGSNTAECRATV